MKKFLVGLLVIVLLAGLAGGSYGLYSHLKGRKAQKAEAVDLVKSADPFIEFDGSKVVFNFGEEFVKMYSDGLRVKHVKLDRNARPECHAHFYDMDKDHIFEDSSVERKPSIERHQYVGEFFMEDHILAEPLAAEGITKDLFKDGMDEALEAKVLKVVKAAGHENGFVAVFDSTDTDSFFVVVYSFADHVEADAVAGTLKIDLKDMLADEALKMDFRLCVGFMCENLPFNWEYCTDSNQAFFYVAYAQYNGASVK